MSLKTRTGNNSNKNWFYKTQKSIKTKYKSPTINPKPASYPQNPIYKFANFYFDSDVSYWRETTQSWFVSSYFDNSSILIFINSSTVLILIIRLLFLFFFYSSTIILIFVYSFLLFVYCYYLDNSSTVLFDNSSTVLILITRLLFLFYNSSIVILIIRLMFFW